jgi:3-phosphoshikimate 1-carboxyvinyltransferase
MGVVSDSFKFSLDTKQRCADIDLPASKSLSNRVLAISSLCDEEVEIKNLSEADDTQILRSLLRSKSLKLNAGHAGTTFRFLTALLSLRSSEYILTGSDRMKSRPIGPLVEALKELGATIEYLEKEGFPPLKIGAPKWKKNQVSVRSDISSQFLSALLMIGSKLPDGLRLTLKGELVSKPYLDMTVALMEQFGINLTFENNTYEIPPQKYSSRPITIENDWSSASYWFGLVAVSKGLQIKLSGLKNNSLQGDRNIVNVLQKLGVESVFFDNYLVLTKSESFVNPEVIEVDFKEIPDLAQTVCVVCAILGVKMIFHGVQTLKHKETDRVAALTTELAKVGVKITPLTDNITKDTGREYYYQEGKATLPNNLSIKTYQDHRMALAFSLLGVLGKITIEESGVVSKSYPNYWDELRVFIPPYE